MGFHLCTSIFNTISCKHISIYLYACASQAKAEFELLKSAVVRLLKDLDKDESSAAFLASMKTTLPPHRLFSSLSKAYSTINSIF